MTTEIEHLQKTVDYIRGLLSQQTDKRRDLRDYIYEQRRRTWDDFARASVDPDGYQEVLQIAQTEQRDVQRFERLEQQAGILAMLADDPYFARIDVCEDGDTEKIYIGRRSLMDEETSEVLICDWRADIASLFYDSPLGKTQYKGPYGAIDCKLLLRRQFSIRHGKLEYMFDSDIAIEDEVLQRELSRGADTKLKTIISTLQREQNAVVRDLSGDLVLVSGVAGSGKTSIALHRLAYLMYKFRDKLSAGQILIFSPSSVFNSYIADVLPDLGEDRAVQTSVYTYFRKRLHLKVESSSAQAERILSGQADIKKILYQGSEEFCGILERALQEAVSALCPRDLYYYDTCVRTAQELKQLYFETYRDYKPQIRLEKIKAGIEEYLETQLRRSRVKHYHEEITEGGAIGYDDGELEQAVGARWQRDKKNVLAQLDQMFGLDCRAIFERVSGSTGDLLYEDMLPIAYLGFLAGQIPTSPRIRHVVVDEAQEYPPILYKLLSGVFVNARFTILGDINQATLPYLNEIQQIGTYFQAPTKKYFELKKSYRSTAEINAFVSSLSDTDTDTAFFARHGQPVKTISKKDMAKTLDELSAFHSKAVICKNAAECKRVYAALHKQGSDVTLISGEDTLYPDSTVVIPSYLTKGLEFDAVIIADASDKNWASPAERKALYVSASRAMHALILCK